MKKLYLIAVFIIFSSCNYAYAQKIEVEQTFVDDAAKAFKLVIDQRDAIGKLESQVTALQKLTEELTRQKATPCTIAQEKVKLDFVFWLDQLNSADKTKQQEVKKILKQTRKSGRQSVAAACGFKDTNQFIEYLKTAGALAPLLLLLK